MTPKAKPQHYLEYAIYRLFETAFRFLPLKVTFHFGNTLGKTLYYLLPKLRRTVCRNIWFAFHHEKSEQELQRLVKESFGLTLANLFSALVVPFLPTEKIRELIEVEGLELLEESFSAGKGTLVLIPHMGNWELLPQACGFPGLPIEMATHYRPLNNPLLNGLIERRRRTRGLHLFPKRTSALTLSKFLGENKFLAILADQRVPKKGVLCHFFGRPTLCSPLPAALAARSGANVLGLHCITVAPGRWKLIFTKCQPTENGYDVQACATNLEQAWRGSPSDVFWLQDRWKLPRNNPLAPFANQPPPKQEMITTPLRFSEKIDCSEHQLPDYLYQYVASDDPHPRDL